MLQNDHIFSTQNSKSYLILMGNDHFLNQLKIVISYFLLTFSYVYKTETFRIKKLAIEVNLLHFPLFSIIFFDLRL